MSAFPPHRSIASIPVSPEIALKFLSTYLEKTNTLPYLLPNAKLEPSGPTAGSSASSVTIHNLQRIEAGLKGEWLAPTLELEAEDADAIAVETPKNPEGEGEAEGWQDLDEYQREQSVEEGGIGPRQTGVAQEGVPNSVPDEEQGEEQDEEELDAPKAKKLKTEHKPDGELTQSTKTPKDKEARKREKAARNDKLKKEKEQKRKEAANKSKKAAE
ncbi:uncharacterized protein BP5553_01177 [Venustampulla echinocandica]|uniref:Uncharacterized protein n=1 Tax=Venustampulla echinocandica TaxID=2656787 RepID=A0A370U098_9HELO|nr:uncharacterized protein BP5553_01177 [Venustampulla echinocandica]RDL41198.1 hypothetical protein BP5553_01177 [Venustampulla echinocandica]